MAADSVKKSLFSSEFVIESDWSDFGSAQRIIGKAKSLAQPSQRPLHQNLAFPWSNARYSLVALETPRNEAGNKALTTRPKYISALGIVELTGYGKGKVCNLRAQQVAHSQGAEALRSFRS